MYKFNDLSGQKFGKLTVINQAGRSRDRHILWNCVCDCGNIVRVSSSDLKSLHTQSCGCWRKQTTSINKYKHGDRNARLYHVWKSMRKRCENKNCKAYQYYGEKGVSVCEEWKDYRTFKAWAMQNGYDEEAPYGICTIDRINPYGNYEPSNCRWVGLEVQANNKRRTAEMGGNNNA